MVREQIAGRGIRDPRVIAAMSAVPREAFVPDALVRALETGAGLVIPVGRGAAALHVLTRLASGVEDRILFDVRFVPLLPRVAPGEGSGGLEALG